MAFYFVLVLLALHLRLCEAFVKPTSQFSPLLPSPAGSSQYGQQQEAYQGPPPPQGYAPQQQQYPGQQGYAPQQQGYGEPPAVRSQLQTRCSPCLKSQLCLGLSVSRWSVLR